jgi:peroxiredoxin
VRSQSLTSTLLVVLLGCSGVFNLALSVKVASLQHRLHPVPLLALPGTHIPDLVGRDASGAGAAIRFSDSERPTVLLVLHPRCPWCEKNMPNWVKLTQEAASRYRFVAVSTADSEVGLGAYLTGHGLALPALAGVTDPKALKLLRAGGTPQTIVVARDGTVVRFWQGAYTVETKADVEKYFQVSLPVAVAPSP